LDSEEVNGMPAQEIRNLENRKPGRMISSGTQEIRKEIQNLENRKGDQLWNSENQEK